jgi:microcystin degradation protein MlrC
MLAGESFLPSFRQLGFLIPIIAQCTDLSPARELYGLLEEIEAGEGGVASWFPGFPAADFPHCRPSVLCYAGEKRTADRMTKRLAEGIESAEARFNQPVVSPEEAISAVRHARAGRPVVIADIEDNPGAGASSDTTGILRAMIVAGVEDAAIGLMVDGAAARAAVAAGVGATIRIGLGGHSGIPDDVPLIADFIVEALSDGKLETSGPYYGRSPMNLGPSACLRAGGVRIVVASHKAQMADLEMFRFAGIEPTAQRLVVVKSSVHFRAAFAPIAAEIVLCSSPGAMPADPARLPWTRLAAGVRLRPLGPRFEPKREEEQ